MRYSIFYHYNLDNCPGYILFHSVNISCNRSISPYYPYPVAHSLLHISLPLRDFSSYLYILEETRCRMKHSSRRLVELIFFSIAYPIRDQSFHSLVLAFESISFPFILSINMICLLIIIII